MTLSIEGETFASHSAPERFDWEVSGGACWVFDRGDYRLAERLFLHVRIFEMVLGFLWSVIDRNEEIIVLGIQEAASNHWLSKTCDWL